MMKKRVYYSFLCVVLILTSFSCKKQLEIEPRQSIDASTALNTRENINAAIVGIYARLKSTANYGRDLLAVAEALGDNAFATNKSGRLVAENQNSPNAHFVLWNNNYFGIYEINRVLEAIPKLNITPAVTAAENNSWYGQLYFLRALFYHDLMRAYAYEPGMGVQGQDRGGVPVVLNATTDIASAVANLPARASVDSVYRRIYADLGEANRLLTNPATFSPYFATKVGAQALYARVSLYNRDWSNAARWSDSVLSTAGIASRLTNTASYVGGWTSQQHPESLFEIRFANQAENIGVNTSLQTSYTTLLERGNPNVLGGFGDLVPASPLLTALGFTGFATNGSGGTFSGRSDDVRNLLFERGNTGRGTARIECTKFIGKNGFPNLDNVPAIRLPEVYLIRSEARMNLNNLSGAAQDIVTLKQARYSNYATTQSGTDAALTTTAAIFSQIQLQRRIEFAFEGHRWFDFKRWGLNLPKTTATLYTGYTDFKVLAPIPIRETDINPNILQNFGY